jgi:hypothetical protein
MTSMRPQAKGCPDVTMEVFLRRICAQPASQTYNSYCTPYKRPERIF